MKLSREAIDTFVRVFLDYHNLKKYISQPKITTYIFF